MTYRLRKHVEKRKPATEATRFIRAFFSPFFLKGRAKLCVRNCHLLTFLILTYDKWCVLESEACFIFLFHPLKHLRTQLLLTHAVVAHFTKLLLISKGQLLGKQQKLVERATPPESRAAQVVLPRL